MWIVIKRGFPSTWKDSNTWKTKSSKVFWPTGGCNPWYASTDSSRKNGPIMEAHLRSRRWNMCELKLPQTNLNQCVTGRWTSPFSISKTLAATLYPKNNLDYCNCNWLPSIFPISNASMALLHPTSNFHCSDAAQRKPSVGWKVWLIKSV